MIPQSHSPHDRTWYTALSVISIFSAALGYLLSLSPWHGVTWLRDAFKLKHVEDRSDVWVKEENDGDVDKDSANHDARSLSTQAHKLSAICGQPGLKCTFRIVLRVR